MSYDSTPEQTETVVIGAGPGGYVAAIRAAQLDVDVTLVDREYGGTCLNRGCIPSKALITATETVHRARTAAEMGVEADITVDMAQLQEWKDGVVDQLTVGVEKLCKANRVSLVEGYAQFLDDRTLHIDGDGGPEQLSFETAIIATGSQPVEIPGFPYDHDRILHSGQVLDLREIPDSLTIIGAGYIGMELAGVFARLGTDVTVIEMLDSVMATYESDLVRPVKQHAQELGVTFHLGEGASEWSESPDGVTVVTETEAGDRNHYESEYVLVAVGRQPVTGTLDLEHAGLEPDENGFLPTDERTRTDRDHILAVGDVAGEPMLAHKASAEGQVAAAVAAGHDETVDYRAIPSAVFTSPEVATVGYTETEAREAGLTPTVGEFPLRASGRSLTLDNTEGFVRLVADAEAGRIVGGQIVGPEASELIAEVTLAVEAGLTLEQLAETVHTHPTLAESVMEAGENALGQAIHTLNR